MLKGIGKHSGESVESVLKKEKKDCGKDLQKREVLGLEWITWIPQTLLLLLSMCFFLFSFSLLHLSLVGGVA